MPKYESIISVTAEVSAENEQQADEMFFGEMTKRLLETASKDNTFQIWVDVQDIYLLDESTEE